MPDVRGSTALAERLSPTEFKRLLNRFYGAATRAFTASDAIIDKLVGDEVLGHYYPGLARSDHAAKAVRAAERLLEETGHRDAGGPWLSGGVGVHTGISYVGTVGSGDAFSDITALGDAVNVAARLASLTDGGEILISAGACRASRLDFGLFEHRQLDLKGRDKSVDLRVLRISPGGLRFPC